VHRRINTKDTVGGAVTAFVFRSSAWMWIQPMKETRRREYGADRNIATHVAHLMPGTDIASEDRLVAVVNGVTRTFRLTGKIEPGSLASGDLARIRAECYEENGT
jgi:hypothetical protein